MGVQSENRHNVDVPSAATTPVGGLVVDPTALPADLTAGNIGRAIVGMKGQQYADQITQAGGEDLPNDTQVTEERWTDGSGGILAASGTGEASPCRVAVLEASETGGANPYTVRLRDGGAGGTIRTVTYYVPAGQHIQPRINREFATDVYVEVVGGAGTPSMQVLLHAGA